MESLLTVGLVNVVLAALLALVVLVLSRVFRRPALLHALWLLVLLNFLAPPLVPLPVLPAEPAPVVEIPAPGREMEIARRFIEEVQPPRKVETLLVPAREPMPAMLIIRVLPHADADEGEVVAIETLPSSHATSE